MTIRSDYASLDLAGRRLDTWESYEITSDLLTPADSWSLAMPFKGSRADRAELLEAVRSSPTVKLYIGRDVTGRGDARALQMTGIVDKLAFGADRSGGSTLHISGRDLAGQLTSAHADVSLRIDEYTNFVTFVRALTRPYGIDVMTEPSASRDILTGGLQSADITDAMEAQARAAGISRERARRAMLQRVALGVAEVPVGGRVDALLGGVSSARAVTTGAELDRRMRELVQQGGSPLDAGAGAGEAREASRARRGSAAGQTGSDVERLAISDARPRPGETIWEFIDRHCRRFGVLPWMDPRGRLILGAPHYDQQPLGRLQRWLDGTLSDQPNNIISGGVVEDLGSQPSTVTVYGRAPGHDATRSAFRSTVTNPDAALVRPMVIHDPSVRSEAEAERRALRELSRQRREAVVLEYEVRDHGLGRYLYAIDTVWDISDEACDIEGRYYCTTRTFSKDRDKGTTTRLRFVPRFAITL